MHIEQNKTIIKMNFQMTTPTATSIGHSRPNFVHKLMMKQVLVLSNVKCFMHNQFNQIETLNI